MKTRDSQPKHNIYILDTIDSDDSIEVKVILENGRERSVSDHCKEQDT